MAIHKLIDLNRVVGVARSGSGRPAIVVDASAGLVRLVKQLVEIGRQPTQFAKLVLDGLKVEVGLGSRAANHSRRGRTITQR